MEQRIHKRKSVSCPVLVSAVLNGHVYEEIGYLDNISEGGVSLYIDREVPSSTMITCNLGILSANMKIPLSFDVLDCKKSKNDHFYSYKVRAALYPPPSAVKASLHFFCISPVFS